MNRETLMDAIGQLPEGIIADVAQKRMKKKTRWTHWAALAACLCLVLILPLALGSGLKAASKAEMEAPMEMAPAANGDLYDWFYAGTVQEDGSDLKVSAEHFLATVVEVHDQYLLVEPLEDEWEHNSAHRIEVPIPKPQEFAAGDLLRIHYSGYLRESYPAQAVDVTGIERLG